MFLVVGWYVVGLLACSAGVGMGRLGVVESLVPLFFDWDGMRF